MYTAHLTSEEQEIARHLDEYFKNKNMTFREKVFHALLIAQHELDAQYFCSEDEKEKIIHFKAILDRLLLKLPHDQS